MLDADEFETLIAARLELERTEVTPKARLEQDLGLGSLRLMELMALLADEFGVTASEQDWLAVETVAGLYNYYRAGLPGPAVGSPLAGSAVGGSAVGASAVVGARRNGFDAGPDHPSVTAGAGGAPAPPSLVGRFFRLLPLVPSSVPFLYDLAASPDVGFRWRYRGAVPNYAAFEAELHNGMLAQFVVASLATGEPAGHVICYNPDIKQGHAYLGAAFSPAYTGSGLPIDAIEVFIRYVFDVWPFRKLYFEMPEFNYTLLGGGLSDRLHLEGELKRHDYYGGRFWSRYILAIYRESFGPALS